MSAGGWKTVYETSMYMPADLPKADDSMSYLAGWSLPAELFGRSPDPRWSIQTLSRWLRSGIWVHKLTGTLFGGPYGLKWAVLLITRALWCLSELQEGRPVSRAPPARHNVREDLQVVRSDILWLAAELDRSCKLLGQMRKTAPDVSQLRATKAEEYKLIPRHIKPAFLVSHAQDYLLIG